MKKNQQIEVERLYDSFGDTVPIAYIRAAVQKIGNDHGSEFATKKVFGALLIKKLS